MKALQLLKANLSVEQRAENFINSVKRNLQKKLDSLTEEKEKIEDKIADLQNFKLVTDINKGEIGLTRDQVEERFSLILELEYQLELLNKKIEIKTQSFNKYFGGENE
jgi:hypothetical protein